MTPLSLSQVLFSRQFLAGVFLVQLPSTNPKPVIAVNMSMRMQG